MTPAAVPRQRLVRGRAYPPAMAGTCKDHGLPVLAPGGHSAEASTTLHGLSRCGRMGVASALVPGRRILPAPRATPLDCPISGILTRTSRKTNGWWRRMPPRLGVHGRRGGGTSHRLTLARGGGGVWSRPLSFCFRGGRSFRWPTFGQLARHGLGRWGGWEMTRQTKCESEGQRCR